MRWPGLRLNSLCLRRRYRKLLNQQSVIQQANPIQVIAILSFNLLEHHNLNLHQHTEAVFINTIVDIKTIVLYSSINNFQDHWQHILFIIYFALDVKVINQCDDGSRVRSLITPIYSGAVVKAVLGSKLHRTTSLQREENKCGTRGQPR